MSNKPHVVVVGAGILGASIAVHLTARGAQVTIVDGGMPGMGATRVSYAWLNGYGKNPFHYHDINRRSLDSWPRFARQLEQHSRQRVELTWGGELRWAVTDAGAETLINRAKVLQSWGYPNQILTAAEVGALEPELNTDGLRAASYSPIDGHVNTQQVVQAALAVVEDQGGEVVKETPVTGLTLAEGASTKRVTTVEIGNGSIPCDFVVLAGGKDTHRLAQFADVALPQHDTFGCTIITEPLPPIFKNIAALHSPRDAEPLVNFRQFGDGSVMVQSHTMHNEYRGDRGETDEEIAQVMADAAGILPALQVAKVQEIRRGRRPIPNDGEPIVGFVEPGSNLYVVTTHSGVTLAPLLGELAAIEIADQIEVDLLAPFRLSRFA